MKITIAVTTKMIWLCDYWCLIKLIFCLDIYPNWFYKMNSLNHLNCFWIKNLIGKKKKIASHLNGFNKMNCFELKFDEKKVKWEKKKG